MPQMAPYSWTMMFFLFSVILIMQNSFVYFIKPTYLINKMNGMVKKFNKSPLKW